MISNRSSQSSDDTMDIDQLRQRYLECIQKRSQNSTDFAANIECLEELKKIIDDLKIIFEKNVVQPTSKKSHYANLFSTNKLQKKILHAEYQFQSFINDFLAPIQANVLAEFAKEPRITELYYFEEKAYNKHHSLTMTTNHYRIVFADGSKIKLNNLQPINLEKARVIFNLKMIALAPEYQKVPNDDYRFGFSDGSEIKFSDVQQNQDDLPCSFKM